jgi:CubicO group peptidase (beta-lactamase class C family)
MERLTGFPIRLAFESLNPHSNIMRALHGSELPHDELHIYARNLEIPSGGGVGSARGLAGAYSVFANGGRELGLTQDTLERLAAPAVLPSHGAHDECMKGDSAFAYGFMKPNATIRFGSPSAYGHPGAGGAMGYADPETGLAWAYVTNRMGTTVSGDPRDVALRDALYGSLAS